MVAGERPPGTAWPMDEPLGRPSVHEGRNVRRDRDLPRLCFTVHFRNPDRGGLIVAGVHVPEPPKACLAHAVGTLAANELKQRQDSCPRGPDLDKGLKEETVLLEVETFPLPPVLEVAGRAKLPVRWPAKADHLGRGVQRPAQGGVHVLSLIHI